MVNKGQKQIPMISMYETAEAKKYKKDFTKYVLEQAHKQSWNLIPNKYQHFYVDCIFYFDRIDKDANNYFKIMLDAITDTQKIWVDDNTALERVNRVYYDSKNPRIEIEIYPVDYIGIFDTIGIFETFKNKCETCSRYKRNCSILAKAIDGKIQEEIVDNICSEYKLIK
jgi:Holliday junction resolvase RusA-like endonuclease